MIRIQDLVWFIVILAKAEIAYPFGELTNYGLCCLWQHCEKESTD